MRSPPQADGTGILATSGGVSSATHEVWQAPITGPVLCSCQPATLASARATGVRLASMLRAFQVGKALTSDTGPRSWRPAINRLTAMGYHTPDFAAVLAATSTDDLVTPAEKRCGNGESVSLGAGIIRQARRVSLGMFPLAGWPYTCPTYLFRALLRATFMPPRMRSHWWQCAATGAVAEADSCRPPLWQRRLSEASAGALGGYSHRHTASHAVVHR